MAAIRHRKLVVSAVITLLTARGKTLSKQFTKTENGWSARSYDSAKTFDVMTAEVGDIGQLSGVLTMLEAMPDTCVVRGRLIDPTATSGVLRRIWPTKDEPAYFEDAACHWMMVDIDKMEAPAGLTTSAERLDYLVSRLDPCFQSASYHYQWSSSAGMDGWKSLSCHLWFWLSAPVDDHDIKALADAEEWPIDLALLNAVQVHYSAAPRFLNCADPLAGERSGFVKKAADAVELPLHRLADIKAAEDARAAQRKADRDARDAANPISLEERGSRDLDDLLGAIGPHYHLPI